MDRRRRRGFASRVAILVCSCLAIAGAACSSTPGASPTTRSSGTGTTGGPATTAAPTTGSTTTSPPTTGSTTTSPASSTTLPGHWTEEEELAQLIMVGADFSDLPAASSAVRQGVGGLVLFGMPSAGTGPSIVAGLAALQAEARVHVLMATDEEGGGVARLADVIGSMPWPRQMAGTMTPEQVRTLVTERAKAMAGLGIDMDLAPVLDTASNSDPVDEEALRSFSEDGSTAASYGLAFIAGLRAGGVIATAKHFPGLGHANADTDLGPATDPPLSELVGNDLVPFRAAIADGVGSVMMSNVTEPSWGSLPASLNPNAYSYLRSLGFGGVIITDALNAGAIRDAGYSAPQAVVKAIEAGADIAMVAALSDFEPALADLERAVQDGQLSMTQVTKSVERILQLKHMA